MFSLLCSSFFDTWGIWIIVIIALFAMMMLPAFSDKKRYQKMQEFLSTLKVGDKVKTTSGFYGTIISIRETTDGKVALLEMGEDKKIGYITVDMNAIYMVDAKEDVVRDADGNIIEPKTDEVTETTEDEVAPAEQSDAIEEENVDDADPMEKPKKKAKKSTEKKSTTKKASSKKAKKEAE